MRIGISLKLGIVLFCLGILASGVTATYLFDASRELLLQAAQDRLRKATEVMGHGFSNAVEGVSRDAALLASISGVRELAENDSPPLGRVDTEDRVAGIFRRMMQVHPEYFQVRLIGARGYGRELVRVDRIANGLRRVMGEGLQEKAHFDYVYETLRQLPGTFFVSRIRHNRERGTHLGEGRPTLRIATPVAAGDSQVHGLVVIDLDVAGLFDQLRREAPRGVILYLANADGDFLIHPDQARIFGFENGRRFLVQDQFPGTGPLLGGTETEALFTTLVDQEDGRSQLATFFRVPVGSGIGSSFVLLGLGIPVEQALQGTALLQGNTYRIMAGFSALAILAAMVLSRLLSGPLLRMARTAAGFASGGAPSGLPLTRQDEIGVLARSFNDMAGQIGAQLEELRETEQSLNQVLEAVPSLMVIIDAAGEQILFMNASARERFGWPDDAVREPACQTLLEAGDSQGLRDVIEGRQRIHNREMRFLEGCERAFWGLLSASHLDYRGERGILLSIVDITERKDAELLIHHQANYHPLSDLPNRSLFSERLSQALELARRHGTRVALLFLDLDHFKSVNDSLGHSAGDLLLIEAARRIQGAIRSSDTAGHLSGDEFAVLLQDVGRPGVAESIARKIITRLAEPYELNRTEVSISTSVGITLYPDDGDSAERLLKKADSAMYAAKEGGRNTFRFFTQRMQDQADTHLRLLGELRHALAREKFELLYQPIVALSDGRIFGREALLRWASPNGGLRVPADFLHVVEESGLIGEVGAWVLRTACRSMVERGIDNDLRCSVNVSARQFRNGAMHEVVRAVLQETGLAPERLILEVTESLLLEPEASNLYQLNALRELGVLVYLDDFGTGYSSLSYLKRFPVQALKIDRSYIQGVMKNREDAVLVETIIQMAHNLGLDVVAEGVESGAQRDFLKTLGCDYAQGWLFGRPRPIEDDVLLAVEMRAKALWAKRCREC